MEVYTFNRLAELWQSGVGTELLLLTDNITAGGAALLDRFLLASILLLPRESDLELRGEDVAGTVLLTQRHLQVADRTLGFSAVCEVTAGMPATIVIQSPTPEMY